MAFCIIGADKHVIIGDDDQQIFSELPRKYGLSTPVIDELWARFYADPRLSSSLQVAQLRAEIDAVRSAHLNQRREAVARQRKIRAQDPAVVALIADKLLVEEPVLSKCDEIIALCATAMAKNEGLRCSSD